jgi:lipoyl(octanoyl) transferase
MKMNRIDSQTAQDLLFTDWGLISYDWSWRRQSELFDAVVAAKQAGEFYRNEIIFCEHPHVYTLGRSGKENNMLLGEEQLKAIHATLYHTDRGGDITYHGPGQLVCYPILNLEDFKLGLKEYIHLLEEAVIRVCASYGITAGRLEKATGVWLDSGKPATRKICAMGVRSSRYVTMHGLALNVNTDLRYFSYINPCGFMDKGVTSLRKELGHELPMDEVKGRLKEQLFELLSRSNLKP